jgi:hypothetical protein
MIQYCGTWYGSDRGGFATMFVDLAYLHNYGSESNDDQANEDHYKKTMAC